jgi:hypothetical protein
MKTIKNNTAIQKGIQKGILFICMALFCSAGLFSFEGGFIVGTINKPAHTIYGLSGGTGILIPMVKLEVEAYKLSGTDPLEYSNTLSIGVKFRPKFGRFAPYAVVGIGTEFDTFSFDSDKRANFTLLGGGVHMYLAGMISLRGDIRFLNFSSYTRARLSAGIFVHF